MRPFIANRVYKEGKESKFEKVVVIGQEAFYYHYFTAQDRHIKKDVYNRFEFREWVNR